MHRTTLSLEPNVEMALKKIALKERRSLKAVINDLLRNALQSYKSSKSTHSELNWHTSDAKAADFFDPSDRSTYMDLINSKYK